MGLLGRRGGNKVALTDLVHVRIGVPDPIAGHALLSREDSHDFVDPAGSRRRNRSRTPHELAEIGYAGIVVHGPAVAVRDLTKRFSLLR